MDAEVGELACKTLGPGRLPPVEMIIEMMESVLSKKDLVDESILITAGPTQEALDPIRFITNHSSGKMGFALAAAAHRRGATVILVSGPTSLAVPGGVRFVPVTSAVEMRDAVMRNLDQATVVIKAAAVADYRPARMSGSKIKKTEKPLTLSLERNPDIIAEVGALKGNRILIGFAMETESLVENARSKLAAKNMDFIVANDLRTPDAGFKADTNIVKIIDRSGHVESIPLMEKIDVADRILDRIVLAKVRS